MILVDKITGNVVANGDFIEVDSRYAIIDGRRYHEFKDYNSYVVDKNVPKWRVECWRYIDGTFELTPFGLEYQAELELIAQKEQVESMSTAIQEHLDRTAKNYRYDDMKSARSYAGFINAFQAESTALGQWASECWIYAGQVEADVMAGARAIPTADELVAELPTLSI